VIGVGNVQVVRLVSAVMGVVVGLTFLFGFGNVLDLGLRLGVPAYVAPLVAPAVDLTVVGLLLGTRHLAVHGASGVVLRPAKRLLLVASAVTLGLNVADPLLSAQWGKAAFDAVGPLLLIGWSEVGPALLGAMNMVQSSTSEVPESVPATGPAVDEIPGSERHGLVAVADDLLERARVEDDRHWAEHCRPISAETLRQRLQIGAGRSRALVKAVRSEAGSRRTMLDWSG
jgi:hypothetical protein